MYKFFFESWIFYGFTKGLMLIMAIGIIYGLAVKISRDNPSRVLRISLLALVAFTICLAFFSVVAFLHGGFSLMSISFGIVVILYGIFFIVMKKEVKTSIKMLDEMKEREETH